MYANFEALFEVMKDIKIDQTITDWDMESLHRYFAEINKIPLLTVKEEVQLTRLIKAGDQAALDLLVRTNLRFVVSVAKKYQHRGLSLGDLINEGNLGLIKAATKFDETKGFKFISFAVWWIRQSIMLAISEQTRIVRLPLNMINSITLINKAVLVLEQQLERFPTTAEIAEATSMNEYKILNHLQLARKSTSLHMILDTEVGNTLLDVLTDSYYQPDNQLNLEAKAHEVSVLLRLLTKREAEVLQLYYGLAGREALSLEDIARLFNISRERVRQLKDGGIKKIKKNMPVNQV